LNLGLGAVVALLFLFPGFSFTFWLRHFLLNKEYAVAPPPATSVETLSAVTFGTILSFSLVAFVSWSVQDIVETLTSIEIQDNYRLHEAILRAFDSDSTPKHWPSELLYAFLFLGSITSAFAAYVLSIIPSVRKTYKRWAYGWLARIIEDVEAEVEGDPLVTVFVLSTVQNGGVSLGYEGMVRHIDLGSDKEIKSLHLTGCSRFIVKVGERGLTKKIVNRRIIDNLHLEGKNIANCGFQIMRLATNPVQTPRTRPWYWLPPR
jgi:hypothetical protein